MYIIGDDHFNKKKIEEKTCSILYFKILNIPKMKQIKKYDTMDRKC